MRVLACWADGWGMRAPARGLAVAPHAVLSGRGEAAEQLGAFAAYVLCALHLEQRPLAAWSAGLRAVQDGARREDEAIRRLERAPSWGWTAMEPTSPLLGGGAGGCRRLAMAQRVVQQGTRVLAPGGVALWLSTGRQDEGTALLTPLGAWRHPARRQAKGPQLPPRWRPLPARLSAQGGKA